MEQSSGFRGICVAEWFERIDRERCPSSLDRMLAADGDLAPSRLADINAHVADCDACRARGGVVAKVIDLCNREYDDEQRDAFAFHGGDDIDLPDLDDGLDPGEADHDDVGRERTIAPAPFDLEAHYHLKEATPASPRELSRAHGTGASGSATAPGIGTGIGTGRMSVVATGEASVSDDDAAPRPRRPDLLNFKMALHKLKQSQIHRVTGWPLSKWLTAAALIPILIAGGYLTNGTVAILRADELLTRAAAQETALPIGYTQRMRVSLNPPATPASARGLAPAPTLIPPFSGIGVATRASDSANAPAFPSTMTAADASKVTAVMGMLDAHHFDLRQPLSTAPFQRWRGSLTNKRDHVTLSGDMLLVLRTTTDGPLREVTLSIRRDNYHVVREAFLIDDVGTFEIEEIADYVRPAGKLDAPLAADAAAPAPDVETLQQAELDARLVLGRAGLDLTRAIQVTTEKSVVQVAGPVASAAQRQTATTRLGQLAHVHAALRAPGPNDRTDARELGSSAATAASPSALAPRLDRRLRAGNALVTFEAELTRGVGRVRQRLETLQALAVRYPDGEVGRLSKPARATLQRLLDLHYDALNQDLADLDARMSIVFGSTTRLFTTPRMPNDWQRRVHASLSQAVNLDELVHTLRTTAPTPAPAPESETASGAPPAGAPVDAQSEISQRVWRTFGALWDIVYASPGEAGIAYDEAWR
jgi:hypothetical protein